MNERWRWVKMTHRHLFISLCFMCGKKIKNDRLYLSLLKKRHFFSYLAYKICINEIFVVSLHTFYDCVRVGCVRERKIGVNENQIPSENL